MKRITIVLLITIALLLLANIAQGYAFQLNCEHYISTEDGLGNLEDWQLWKQERIMRADGQAAIKCVYLTYESYQQGAALTGWRGAN